MKVKPSFECNKFNYLLNNNQIDGKRQHKVTFLMNISTKNRQDHKIKTASFEAKEAINNDIVGLKQQECDVCELFHQRRLMVILCFN